LVFGGHRERDGTGKGDGISRQLSVITSSVEREGIPRLLHLISLCVHRANTFTVQHHVYLRVGDWGMKRCNKVVSYIGGTWGIEGGVGYVFYRCGVGRVSKSKGLLYNVSCTLCCVRQCICVRQCVRQYVRQ